MAISLLNYVVEDLCLGKPALNSLCISSATIADALSAIKSSQENFISIWSCDPKNHNHPKTFGTFDHEIETCECVGKVCMVDIICFLCKEDNLKSPSSALLSPISAILPQDSSFIKHVDPSTSLLEAIDLILEGAQNLVVPIQSIGSSFSRRKLKPKGPTIHNGREYCWLTQEDVIRFILSRIGLFTPTPGLSVEELGIIQTKVLTVGYHAPAMTALEAIAQSSLNQTSVGVIDEDGGALIGEISPFTLSACDETVAAALVTLSSGELMSYIDWGGPPEDIVRVMKASLKEKKLEGLLEMLGDDYSSYSSSASSSSDDESVSTTSSSSRHARYSRSWSYSARMMRKAEATVCHPKSSLAAVVIQAIAHRVNYVWVMEDDCTPVGIVTFKDMLKVFREHMISMVEELGA